MSSCVRLGGGITVDFWTWRMASSFTVEDTTCYTSSARKETTSATFCLRFSSASNSLLLSSAYV